MGSEMCIRDSFWAYAHEDDVVDAHVRAVETDCAEPGTHEVYVLAAPDIRFDAPTRELLASAAGLVGVREHSPIDGHASILCSRKARARLGWDPRSWLAEREAATEAAKEAATEAATEAAVAAARGDTSARVAGVAGGGALRPPPLPRGEERGGHAAVLARADPELRALSLGGFALDCGVTLPPAACVTYRMYGAPPDRSAGRGLVLHPTSFDAVHTELEYRIGPGRTLDTERNAVLVVNMLGNGVSLSPSNAPVELARARFPPVTVRDNVRAQAAVLRALGVDLDAADGPPPLDLIFGYSMGGLQAFEWAVRFPRAAKAIAVVCGAARCSPVNQAFLLSLQAALTADARYDPAARCFDAMPADGLRAFARVYAGWGVGGEWYEQGLYRSALHGQRTDATVASFVSESYESGFALSDPDDLLCQLDTWLNADASAHAGGNLATALACVEARVLLMPGTTDRYFTADAARAEAELLGKRCVLAPIESAAGHRAGDPHRRGLEAENAFITDRVRALLDGSL